MFALLQTFVESSNSTSSSQGPLFLPTAISLPKSRQRQVWKQVEKCRQKLTSQHNSHNSTHKTPQDGRSPPASGRKEQDAGLCSLFLKTDRFGLDWPGLAWPGLDVRHLEFKLEDKLDGRRCKPFLCRPIAQKLLFKTILKTEQLLSHDKASFSASDLPCSSEYDVRRTALSFSLPLTRACIVCCSSGARKTEALEGGGVERRGGVWVDIHLSHPTGGNTEGGEGGHRAQRGG